jgi:hypothetical protein
VSGLQTEGERPAPTPTDRSARTATAPRCRRALRGDCESVNEMIVTAPQNLATIVHESEEAAKAAAAAQYDDEGGRRDES